MRKIIVLTLSALFMMTGCASFSTQSKTADLFNDNCDPLFDRDRACMPQLKQSKQAVFQRTKVRR